MRKLKRTIHKQFGGVGNFLAILILVAITVIFINTFVLTKRDCMCFFSFIEDFVSLKKNISAPHESSEDIPGKLELIHSPNQTAKLVNQEPQKIQRSSTPDAGR